MFLVAVWFPRWGKSFAKVLARGARGPLEQTHQFVGSVGFSAHDLIEFLRSLGVQSPFLELIEVGRGNALLGNAGTYWRVSSAVSHLFARGRVDLRPA